MVNDVPTACFMDKLAKNTKTGMIKKPPPAPTKPETVPISKPCVINGTADVTIFGVAKFFCLGFLIIFDDAANITTEKISMISLGLETLTLFESVITSGNNGTNCERVKKTANKEGIPKSSTILKFTFLSIVFLMLPTAEVLPTIKREYAVAITGSIPTTYTRIGTVKMDPPLPTIPNVTPMNRASDKPI